MEPEGSLPHSQVPATCPIMSQLDPVHTPTSLFPKIRLNIILPSTPGSPNWIFPCDFPTKTLYTPLLSPCALHAHPSHSSNHKQISCRPNAFVKLKPKDGGLLLFLQNLFILISLYINMKYNLNKKIIWLSAVL
jgi:hypothetical protein